ncbi:MAG: DMT family transporter [Candidatus Kapaibacterium sp.]|jgi:small multidrug resistance pump
MHWLTLAIAIIAEVVGTSALRASEGFTKVVPSILVVAGYSVAFYFLSLTLKNIPVGIAYAIWSGVGTVLITIVGVVVFNQRLDVPAIVGLSLILIGVLVINLFSKSVAN